VCEIIRRRLGELPSAFVLKGIGHLE